MMRLEEPKKKTHKNTHTHIKKNERNTGNIKRKKLGRRKIKQKIKTFEAIFTN
jgi:hypothetical protein